MCLFIDKTGLFITAGELIFSGHNNFKKTPVRRHYANIANLTNLESI